MITTILLASFNWGCIWPLLLAAILPFFLGYWFRHTLSGRDRQALREKEEQHLRLKKQFTTLEKDMASLKYEKGELEKEQTALRTTLRSVEADRAMLRARMEEERGQYDPSADQVAGRLRLGGGGLADHTDEELQKLRPLEYHRLLAKDNLQIIEGLTPKAEGVLKDKGIPDWSRLASASQGELNAHLGSEGLSDLDASTWPEQAGLARDHRWNDLAALQRSIREGKPARIDQIVFGVSQDREVSVAVKGEDLKIVEGIGPKIEQLLKDDGINTWDDLAKAEVPKLEAILAKAGKRYRLAKPATWPRQARLAADGKWGELKVFQDELQGGRE